MVAALTLFFLKLAFNFFYLLMYIGLSQNNLSKCTVCTNLQMKKHH